MRGHWLDILHILDSSYPIGGYVHSFGLESLSSARDDLEAVLRLRVEQSLARLELVFVLHAYACDLCALDARYHAMQLVREPREASAALGTNLLRSTTDLLSSARVEAFRVTGSTATTLSSLAPLRPRSRCHDRWPARRTRLAACAPRSRRRSGWAGSASAKRSTCYSG